MKNFKTLVEENKVYKLYELIVQSIDKVDDNLSVDEFSKVITKVLVNDYGSHNYDKFIKVLVQGLK